MRAAAVVGVNGVVGTAEPCGVVKVEISACGSGLGSDLGAERAMDVAGVTGLLWRTGDESRRGVGRVIVDVGKRSGLEISRRVHKSAGPSMSGRNVRCGENDIDILGEAMSSVAWENCNAEGGNATAGGREDGVQSSDGAGSAEVV